MQSEKQLHQLQASLRHVWPVMVQAAATVQDEEVSNYPVFVLFEEGDGASLGIPLLDAEATQSTWHVNASTLEELAAKKIVAMEQVERFTAVYKTHPEALCCLIHSAGDAQFAFIPNP